MVSTPMTTFDLSDSALLTVFASSIAEVSRKTFPKLTLDQPIAELGLDSLAMLEVIGFLEDAYSVTIDETALRATTTLQSVADHIRAQRTAQEAM
jgi:acyl carrier protein